jgi:hypothetical protein
MSEYIVQRDRRKQYWITKKVGINVYGETVYVRHDGPFATRQVAEALLPGLTA